jgi:hypothetical protein
MKPKKPIETLILNVRSQKVILDADLAELYGVPTKVFNQAVKRNVDRFPEDFMFQLTAQEFENLKSQFATSSLEVPQIESIAPNWSQIVTSSKRHRGAAYRPYAFTEHGALMAANVLHSKRAVEMSVFVVRAFLKMRAMLSDTRELARKLATLESELKSRLDVHEAAIVDVLQRIMRVLDPPPLPPEPTPPEIGFHIKEATVPYRMRRTRWIYIDKCHPAYGSEKYGTADDINLVISTKNAKDLAGILNEVASEAIADVKIRISRKPTKSEKKHRIAILFEN